MVVLGGAIGLRLIEGWTWLECIWMAVITVTTIGFGEIRPLSDEGRLFTLIYIFAAVGVGGYALSALTGYVVGGDFVRELRARRQRERMQHLKDHFIVVGYGRLGSEVAEDLLHEHAHVVVIDVHEDSREQLPKGAMFIHGDGSRDEVLVEAGIKSARGIAVATPSSAVNVFITLSARQLNPKLYIITRVDEDSAEDKARLAGANAVVSPFATAGTRIAHRLLHKHAAEFVEQMLDREFRGLALDDVPVPPTGALSGSLADLKLRDRFGVVVIAVRRADGTVMNVPDTSTSVGPGDILVVVGSEVAILGLRQAVDARGG